MQTSTCPVGVAVASWSVHLTPDRAVRAQALAWDILLCSWARHFTLIQMYKWVLANLIGSISVSGQLRAYPSPNPTCYNELIS